MNVANDNLPIEELNEIADRFLKVGERLLEQGMYYDALDAFLMSKEIFQKTGVINV